MEINQNINSPICCVIWDMPLSDEKLQILAEYEKVEFCGSFNQPVDNLPSGLKSLTSGFSFNQSVDK